ncbi:MAG: HAMP domain-containing histidine kinase [Prolixibacteraceae bacterium]|nr:HAMP domain-containing histidine kinase [Prolixibacteraceae bacterium]
MSKLNKQNFLAFFTFIALVVLLGIQLNWIFKAARLEEQNFNRMVTKALVEAREEIGNTASNCNEMKDYLCGNPCQVDVRKQKIEEIDSIIRSKLEIFHINMDYTFEITDSIYTPANSKLFGARCYLQSLNGLLEKDGIKIRLEFPDRNQFLLAQIRGEFLIALLALFFVMASFIMTSRMFRKEREMVQQTSDFINNMVHEFQTPLSNIRFATNLIKKKEPIINDEKISEYLSVILLENQKLEKHVDEILKVMCSGNDPGVLEQVDMHQLIHSNIKAFATRLESLNGSIVFHPDAVNYTIDATTGHMKLVLSNLIDNAIKYAREVPDISITTLNKGNNLVLVFKDKGIGMEKKELPRIFDKYYRVSTGDVHNVKGFGLGLTYVKKIIEQYNGNIDVTSTPGKGTVFTIFLPLKNETDKNTVG